MKYIDVPKLPLSLLVPWYLMACYLYYEKDVSIMTDTDFDLLCKRLLEHYKQIDHRHKDLIDEEALMCGTGYQIDLYPSIVKGAADRLAKELKLT